MLSETQVLTFDPISELDIPILAVWLNLSEEEVESTYLTSQEGVQRYVVSGSGKPFGYIQANLVNGESPYEPYSFPGGITVTIDLFIGERAFLRKGYSFQMLAKFITFLGPAVNRVLVDPVVGSTSIKPLQSYGFNLLGKIASDKGERQILGIDIRHVVRGLILNEDQHLLLTKLVNTENSWAPIGEEVEVGETELQALNRAFELLGVENHTIGKLAFFGEHALIHPELSVRHFEKFYLVYVNNQETPSTIPVDENTKWWSVKELLAESESIHPRGLPKELQKLLKRGKSPKEISLST